MIIMKDDVISRQDALKAICFLEAKNDKANVFSDDFDNISRTKSMIAINSLPSAQPEQRWIPCSERLPDNDESVLISNSHGVTKAWWNGRFWTSIAVKKYKTVTAWMPLPEPYREGENES